MNTHSGTTPGKDKAAVYGLLLTSANRESIWSPPMEGNSSQDLQVRDDAAMRADMHVSMYGVAGVRFLAS